MPMQHAQRAPQAAFGVFPLPNQGQGRRTALEAALERLEDLRQEMIAALDDMDGDPDLEEQGDHEWVDECEPEEGV